MQRVITVILSILLIGSLVACKTEYVHVGANWEAIHNLKSSEKTFKVWATGKDKLKLGDELTFSVTAEKDGKLWIVQVGPDDKVTLLFPNDRVKENKVAAQKAFQVPPKGAGWHIAAGEPKGKSVVAFVVTEGDTDLSQVLGQKDAIAKALRLVENAPSWGLEKIVIDVQ